VSPPGNRARKSGGASYVTLVPRQLQGSPGITRQVTAVRVLGRIEVQVMQETVSWTVPTGTAADTIDTIGSAVATVGAVLAWPTRPGAVECLR